MNKPPIAPLPDGSYENFALDERRETIGHADILHVTPTADWQRVTARAEFALRSQGLQLTLAELTKPQPPKLSEAIQQRQPRVVFIHAFAVAANHVIAMARQFPAVRFVVVSHSHENHLALWPSFFAELRQLIGAGLPNLWYAGSAEANHWQALGYNVRRWRWPCAIEAYQEPPDVDPPRLLITSRADIVKAIPAQLLAAALAQRQRGVKVAVSLRVGNLSPMMELAAAAGLVYDVWPWADHAEFLRRLREEISIVLQPSMSETFNYVSWEAGSVGRSWVGSTAIRHTPAAWQADPNDPTDIARVACQILDDYHLASRQARLIAETVAAENNAGYAADVKELLSPDSPPSRGPGPQ